MYSVAILSDVASSTTPVFFSSPPPPIEIGCCGVVHSVLLLQPGQRVVCVSLEILRVCEITDFEDRVSVIHNETDKSCIFYILGLFMDTAYTQVMSSLEILAQALSSLLYFVYWTNFSLIK